MRGTAGSWEEITVELFAGARVAERPIVSRIDTEDPVGGRGMVVETLSEDEPCGARWRLAGAGEPVIIGDEFELPCDGGDSDDDEREWGLGEFDEDLAVGVGRVDEFSGELDAIVTGAPDGLAAADVPAGQGEIRRGKGCDRATSREGDDDEREPEEGDGSERFKGNGTRVTGRCECCGIR